MQEHSFSGKSSDGRSVLSVNIRCSNRFSGSAVDTSDGGERVVLPLHVTDGDVVYLSAELIRETDGTEADSRQTTTPGAIESHLKGAAAAYEATRVRTTGHWDGLAASVTNNLHWMHSIKPETGRRYTPAGRRWIFPKAGGGRDHWTTFCWDGFLNAVELGIESADLARETLLAVLETQYHNGNIPNWRGRFAGTPDRSQPPVGSFAVLKYYLRTGDRELLERAFPYLERWSAWWRAPKADGLRRDGNGNGLFEWGCDVDLLSESPASWENEASHHQMAAWESGQDDLPNWDMASWVDRTGTFDLDCVDLNSLMALDHECLAEIAGLVGLSDIAGEYHALYRELVAKINECLWDEDQGMYVDRSWDGRRSRRLAASNFYPLIAGIPDAERVRRMLENLLDENRFWGPYVIPSISRNDPAFGDQQYWRGTIWPPPNYLVYQGLRRYGLDEVAGELAARSVDLFLRSWRDHQVCHENYDSRTGAGGGHAFQSWGPLFAVMGIEEFVDVTPWDGLRVGTLTPPPRTTLHNIRIRDHTWKVTLAQEGLNVEVDGRRILHTRGAIVLREFETGPSQLSAETLGLEPVTVAVVLGSETVKSELDGEATVQQADSIVIPAGIHKIGIQALTDTG
jgi:glycogen debranching enzyme